jgi:hypothetical protein
MATGNGPPDRACVVHHRTDELLVQQHAVSDGQATSPVKEGTEHAKSLSCLSSYLFDVCRPGKLSIKGYPEISHRFDPCCWLFEKLNWSGFLDASCKEHRCAHRDFDRNSPVP